MKVFQDKISGRELEASLNSIGVALREQLVRLDISSGEEYLSRAMSVVSPVQERIGAVRYELIGLGTAASAAKETKALRSLNDRIIELACELYLELPSVQMVHEFCTTARDAIAGRTLELAKKELYFSGASSESRLALLSVGSDGRKEHTLLVDQDYLFLYGAGDDESLQPGEELAEYFGVLGSVFSEMLDEIGITRCSGGIMPVNHQWSGSLQQWQERLNGMLKFEKADWEKNILSLVALMDSRFVYGDSGFGLGFGRMVRSMVRNNSEAIRHFARVVSSMKLSRGFLNRFVLESEGPHEGEFNIKIMAWMPLVMGVRMLAVNHGIEETSTIGRLEQLHANGHLGEKLASGLISAYHLITGHRIRLQMKRLNKIIDDDCYINPNALTGVEREALREAVGRIEELQSMIRNRFSLTASAERRIGNIL